MSLPNNVLPEQGEEKIELFDSAISVFGRLAFRFEFFFPQVIGLYMKRKLNEYKEKGILDDYQVKSGRRGKYHYIFDVNLFLKIDKGGERLWLKKRKDT